MTTTANKALVSRYYDEVLTQRNLAALDDLLAPDFASWLPDGTRLGRVGYRDAVLASHRAFPDLAVEVLDQLGEGDKVATRWRATGTHRGPFAGIPATVGRWRSPRCTCTGWPMPSSLSTGRRSTCCD